MAETFIFPSIAQFHKTLNSMHDLHGKEMWRQSLQACTHAPTSADTMILSNRKVWCNNIFASYLGTLISIVCLKAGSPLSVFRYGLLQYVNLIQCHILTWIFAMIITIFHIYLFTAIGLLPGGSGYFICKQNMKLVTTRFKLGGLYEKHVVATWNLRNRLSICL